MTVLEVAATLLSDLVAALRCGNGIDRLDRWVSRRRHGA